MIVNLSHRVFLLLYKTLLGHVITRVVFGYSRHTLTVLLICLLIIVDIGFPSFSTVMLLMHNAIMTVQRYISFGSNDIDNVLYL